MLAHMDSPVLQVGVKALLYNNARQFLLIKRSDKYLSLKGQWDIPGGRIKMGTSLEENLAREIKEETSLLMAYKPILLAAQDIITNDLIHVVRLTYLARSARGEVELQTSEAIEYKWMSWSEIEQLTNLDLYVAEIIKVMPQPLQHLLQSEYVQG